MKCTCIIHDAIDLRQFTLRSTAHRMQLPSSFRSSWPQNNLLIFDGDNGYTQMNPFQQRLLDFQPKIYEMQRTSKNTQHRDRHPGVNWQTYNVLILHWTFICLAVGCYWERPAWTPWTRLKVKQVNMQPKVLRFTFLFCYSTGSWSVSESWPCGLGLEDLDLVLWSQTNGSLFPT